MGSHRSEDPSYYELEMCKHFDENRVEVCVKTGSEQGLLFHFLLKKFPRQPILLFSDYFIADLLQDHVVPLHHARHEHP